MTILSVNEVETLVEGIFLKHGVLKEHAQILSQLIVKAQINGSFSHGLMRIPDYIASMSSNWLNAQAPTPAIHTKGTHVFVDANNGFTQVATHFAQKTMFDLANEFGMAVLNVRNGHHIGALWLDIEPYAMSGMIALNFVNSRCRLFPYGASKKLLGTNAMAFGVSDGQDGMLAWDQASSAMSLGDVKLAQQKGELLDVGIGVDADGLPTQDPNKVLNGGGLLPFGGHKGASIALMVEVLAAALTGGNFGFEDNSSHYSGAASSNAGQCIVVINPQFNEQQDFSKRMIDLLAHLKSDAQIRLPGDRRRQLKTQVLQEHTLNVDDALWNNLMQLCL